MLIHFLTAVLQSQEVGQEKKAGNFGWVSCLLLSWNSWRVGRIHLVYTSRHQSITEGSQDGAWNRHWRDAACWFVCRLMLGYLCHIVQDHLPRDGTTHSGLAPPAPINNQETPPQIFPGVYIQMICPARIRSPWVIRTPWKCNESF